MGPHCSFCGTVTGPFSEIEGLFTVLICIPCLDVRLAQPDTLLGLHDPGQPWEQWGCPIDGCGRWVLGPWDLEGHTTAEHPGWTATYEPNPDGLARGGGDGGGPATMAKAAS